MIVHRRRLRYKVRRAASGGERANAAETERGGASPTRALGSVSHAPGRHHRAG
jgi:hypothetical protein